MQQNYRAIVRLPSSCQLSLQESFAGIRYRYAILIGAHRLDFILLSESVLHSGPHFSQFTFRTVCESSYGILKCIRDSLQNKELKIAGL